MMQRLLKNSVKPDDQNENGCWLWTGQCGNSGYGRFPYRITVDTVNEWGEPVQLKKVRHKSAHREMELHCRQTDVQREADLVADEWLLAVAVETVSMDPDEHTIEHLCCCRRCINPDHWIIVTRAENTSLMWQRVSK